MIGQTVENLTLREKCGCAGAQPLMGVTRKINCFREFFKMYRFRKFLCQLYLDYT